MKTFESKNTDRSFPWRVFNVTFVLYVFSLNFWGWSARKETAFYILATLGSFLPAWALAKFIQYLKTLGTLPPVKVSEKALHIESGIGLGESEIPWKQIHRIYKSTWTDPHRRKAYPSLEIEIADTRFITRNTTPMKNCIWKLLVLLGHGKKYRIIGEQLRDGLDELIKAIEPYHPITKNP